MGLETTETSILEIGAGVLALGMALITGGMVGALLVRRKYGAMLPLVLLLAAVALLLWWESLARVVVSVPLLLLGYTWLCSWWRASQQENAQVPLHPPRLTRGNSVGRDQGASSPSRILEVRPAGGHVWPSGAIPWDKDT